MIKKHRKKIIIGASIIVFLVTLNLVMSPLAKFLLEKYDRDIFGRDLKIKWVYVNLLTGHVHLHNLQMLEANGDSLFISTSSVSGNISILKLLSKTIKISGIMLEEPVIRLTQNKRVFNIDDLILKFTPSKSPSAGAKWVVEFMGAHIVNGEFHFTDKIIPIKYWINNVNIEAIGKLNEGDTIATHFSFIAGVRSGKVKGDFTINTKTIDYRFAVDIVDYDLEIIRQYIWELINYGMFTAHLNAKMHGRGNFSSQQAIDVSGRLSVMDFHLGKTTSNDYAAFKELVMKIERLNPLSNKYLFDSILLKKPFLKYEIYDSLNNIERLIGKRGSNIKDVTQENGRFNLVVEIVRYVKVLSANFFRSNFKINRLQIDSGSFKFNDYSLSEKFSVNAAPLTLIADSINKLDRRVQVSIQSGLHPHGDGSIQLSINPKDSADFNMNYQFKKIPVSIFNPYLVTYTSFPLDKGTIELNGKWRVREGIIKSENHLIVIDPRVSKRLKNKNVKWLPMPLIMALVREEGNIIDYEIPITGNLKHPKFHFNDVLFDLIKNIFIKPPTTPYRLEVKDLEAEIEKSVSLKWEIRQYTLRPMQDKFLKKTAKFLKSNKEAQLSVYPISFSEREKEYILFFEAKKKYFMWANHLTPKSFTKEDSIEVEKMSVKDSLLVKHISLPGSDTVMFTIQDKCQNFVGNKIITERFEELKRRRGELFYSYFKDNGIEAQIKIHKEVNDIPYNGFSYFKLSYGKEIPESLVESYQKMNDFDNEGPREKYKKLR